jgi:hypothetical protein
MSLLSDAVMFLSSVIVLTRNRHFLGCPTTAFSEQCVDGYKSTLSGQAQVTLQLRACVFDLM